MVLVDIPPPAARTPATTVDSGVRNAISTVISGFSGCDSLREGIDCLPDGSRACSLCRERRFSATKDCCLYGNCCIINHLKQLNQFLGGSWFPNFNFLLDHIIHLKAAETAVAIGREITGHGFCTNLPSSCKYQDGAYSDKENLMLYKGTGKNNSIEGQYKSIPETDVVYSFQDCAFRSDLIPEHHTKQQLDLHDLVGNDHITSSINISPQGRGNSSETSEIGLLVHHTNGQNRPEKPLEETDDMHSLDTVSADDRKDLSGLACPSSTGITQWRNLDSNEVITNCMTQLTSLDIHHRSSRDKGHALNTDVADKQHLFYVPHPSSIDIFQWKKSDLNKVTGRTLNHTNDTIDQNQAELTLCNEDGLFVSRSVAKHNRSYHLRCNSAPTRKSFPKKPGNDDPTVLSSWKKKLCESDAASQKESSILLLNEDYETYLEQNGVNGASHVVASEKFPNCSPVSSANEDVDFKDKDYDIFFKHIRPHGCSYISELIDPEQGTVLIEYEEDCCLTKNIKKRKKPVKATATKKTAFNGSSKRSLSAVKKEIKEIHVKEIVYDRSSKQSKVTKKKYPECPFDAKESPRSVQLIKKRFGKSVSSHIYTLSEKSRLCNSSQPTETTANTTFGNIMEEFSCFKSDSFATNLQDLLSKPYSNLEHAELMKEVTCRKPIYKQRQLRGSSKPYVTQVIGLSYLDYYPDFQNRL